MVADPIKVQGGYVANKDGDSVSKTPFTVSTTPIKLSTDKVSLADVRSIEETGMGHTRFERSIDERKR